MMYYSLVHRLVGRLREVKDSTAGPDNSYYNSQLNCKHEVYKRHHPLYVWLYYVNL